MHGTITDFVGKYRYSTSSAKGFPLEHSGMSIELMKQVYSSVRREVIVQLDDVDNSRWELSMLAVITKEEIDLTKRYLRTDNVIYYDRSQIIWCLNSNYIYDQATLSKHAQ